MRARPAGDARLFVAESAEELLRDKAIDARRDDTGGAQVVLVAWYKRVPARDRSRDGKCRKCAWRKGAETYPNRSPIAHRADG
jgi:hypothetical protein